MLRQAVRKVISSRSQEKDSGWNAMFSDHWSSSEEAGERSESEQTTETERADDPKIEVNVIRERSAKGSDGNDGHDATPERMRHSKNLYYDDHTNYEVDFKIEMKKKKKRNEARGGRRRGETVKRSRKKKSFALTTRKHVDRVKRSQQVPALLPRGGNDARNRRKIARMLSEHTTPIQGDRCRSCLSDIDAQNYVEYRTFGSQRWLPSSVCESCVENRVKSQWHDIQARLDSTSVRRVQMRELRDGPPIFLRYPGHLPHVGSEIAELWWSRTGECRSARVSFAPIGDELAKWWLRRTAKLWSRRQAAHILTRWWHNYLPGVALPYAIAREASHFEKETKQRSRTAAPSIATPREQSDVREKHPERIKERLRRDLRLRKCRQKREDMLKRQGRMLARAALDNNAFEMMASSTMSPLSTLSVDSPHHERLPILRSPSTSSSNDEKKTVTSTRDTTMSCRPSPKSYSSLAFMSVACPNDHTSCRPTMPTYGRKKRQGALPRIGPNTMITSRPIRGYDRVARDAKRWERSYERFAEKITSSSQRHTRGGALETVNHSPSALPEWYMRIHQGAKSIHTPENPSRRRPGEVF